MPEHVISNTSPLFYLHRLRQLDLLQKLYTRLLVPEAVVDELQAGRDQGEDVPEVTRYDWIEVRAVRMPAVVTLITDLGAREAQVLALALEVPGSLVLLDDRVAHDGDSGSTTQSKAGRPYSIGSAVAREIAPMRLSTQ